MTEKIRPALLIIDMQNDVVLEGGPLNVAQARSVIPTILLVLKEFRERKLPVFHMLMVHKADGSDVEMFRKEQFRKRPFVVEGNRGAAIIDELVPQPGEYVIPRVRMSAFMGTDLDLRLRTLGITDLVLTGVQTPNCIRTTVSDGIAYDYRIILVRDGIGAQNDEIHKNNLRDMANFGAQIMNAQDLIAMLG